MQRILFEILLDTSTQNMTNFAEIKHRTRYVDEEEILFDINALFNITYVEYDWYLEMWLVKMTVVSKNSINKHSYLDVMRETVAQNHSAIVTFGIILAQGFNRKEQALNYFNQLLLTLPSNHNDIPDILQQQAILYEENGDHASAFRDYERALEIHHERIRANRLGIASIKNHLGMLQSTKSDIQTSLINHKEALDIYEELYAMDKDHLTKAKTNENIGLVYHKNGDFIEAKKYFMRAWTMYNQILPRKHPFMLQVLGYIGAVHEAVDNSTLAMSYFHRQLNWTKNVLPLDHPLLITCFDSILRMHTKSNQSLNISLLFNDQLEKMMKVLGEKHQIIPRLLVIMANLFESIQPMKAIELYEQALNMNKYLSSFDPQTMIKCHKNLAQLYRKSKKLNDALNHANEALIYQQQLSFETDNYSLEADELHNIGLIYIEMNLPTKALGFLSKSLANYRLTYTNDHPKIQTVLTDIIQAANQTESSN